MSASGNLLDAFLTLYLSRGMMIFTALLLVASIAAFAVSKEKPALRRGSVIVGAYCAVYLLLILAAALCISAKYR